MAYGVTQKHCQQKSKTCCMVVDSHHDQNNYVHTALALSTGSFTTERSTDRIVVCFVVC